MYFNHVTEKIYITRQRAAFLLIGLLLVFISAGQSAAQSYSCSDAIYFTSSTDTNRPVFRLVPSTSVMTQMTGITIGAPSAGAAVMPGGARLYSVDNASPYSLRYNSGGSTNSAAFATGAGGGVQRNGIAPNGTGYFMVGGANSVQYYTYTTNTTTPTVNGPFDIDILPGGSPNFANGGDIAFDANGLGYIVDQSFHFYRLDFSTSPRATATFLGTFTGITGGPNGLGFTSLNTASQNFLYLSTLSNTIYRLNIATMTATQVSFTNSLPNGVTFTQNDIASCIYPTGIVPTTAAVKAWRNVTKGDAADFSASTSASPGDTIEYRIIVRNSGVLAAGNTVFQDTIPTGMTYVANSTTLNGSAVTDSSGFPYQSAASINSPGEGTGVLGVDSTPTTFGQSGDNEAVIIFRTTVASPFTTANPIPNTATVNYAGSSGAISSNTVNTPVIVPNLTIAKSHTGSFTRGSTGTYTITVGNSGPTATSGTITVTDSLPSGLAINNGAAGAVTLGGANAANWSCSSNAASPQSIACTSTSGTTIAANGSSVFSFAPTVAANASASVTNTVTVAGGSEPSYNNTNNSANDVTAILVPDLTIAKSHTGNFVRSGTGTYTLTVNNVGTGATNASITVTDTLPNGLTVNNGLAGPVTPGGPNAANWSCSSSAVALNQQTITCTSSTALAAGASSTFTLTVNVLGLTAASVTNTATVSGGNEPAGNTGNNSASDPTTIFNGYSLTGTIFEDANYAGGAGRSLAASGGTGRGGATVELYNSLGVLAATTTTSSAVATLGQYQFTSLASGTYTVRVVNSTVTSARTGSVSTLIGVQTFRTNNGADDANRVGGEDPTKIDAAANSVLGTLVSLITGNFTAQSVSPVTVSTADVTGVNFGFNFDTIVNTNDAGQGSLRQFVTNSNALSGADTTIFMISDGAAHSGLRSGLANQLTGGVASISLSSTLPAITDTNTTIDGATQTSNVGNTNSGNLGRGGSVGVDNLTLSTVNRPEVQITDGNNLAVGLDLQAANSTVRGVAIYGFGTTANNDASANIRLGASAANALIEQNIIGSTASSFTDPGSSARSGGDNVRSTGADNGILRNNLIGFGAGKGFGVEGGSTGWLIENNEIRGNAVGNPSLDGIDLETAGTTGNTVRGNYVADNEGVGVDSYQSNGSNTVVNNTITNNGIGSGSGVETAGVRMYGASNLIDRNVINANYGAGVMVSSAASANTITRNSIYANGTVLNKAGGAASGQIGIDLLSASDDLTRGTAPYVTLNDSGDADAGGNGLLNFPVLESAQILNGNLVLTGFARPGAVMEFFIAAPDPSGFGEGQTYLVTLTEGSAQDGDATTGAYTSPFNGKTVGTDSTNRFQFSIPVPSGVSSGTVLTATATLSAATSEFSNTLAISNAPPALGLVKTVTPTGTQLPGTELTYTISFTNTGGQSAANFVLTDPNPANTTLKLNTNTDFKIGSVTNSLGTTGLTATIAYSNDGGATFTYTPVSAGGGAAAGFDRNITHVRWSFSGNLSHLSPNNSGSVSFIVKIR